MGLSAFMQVIPGDDDFVPVFEFIIGCYETVDMHEDLQWPDTTALLIELQPGGSECAIKVVTHHYVPDSDKLVVERDVWECFQDSRNIQETLATSCAGRYSFIGGHVKWLPDHVTYLIEQGEKRREAFTAIIPWIEEKLGVTVSETEDPEDANLLLRLDDRSTGYCPEAWGCNVVYEKSENNPVATIYVSAPDQYFAQVLKHEVLHALLPMGHLPQSPEHLMTVRSEDPEGTQTLSDLEEKLLKIYTYQYLRDGITMEKFRPYLILTD